MTVSRGTRQRAESRRAQRRRQTRTISIIIVGVIAVLLAGVLILASLRSAEQRRIAAEGTEIGFSIGDPDAPVLMEEFSDYSCSYCAQFAVTSRQLVETFVDDGTLRVIHMPTSFLNLPNSEIAGAAAVCAGDQGSYWEMYDILFSIYRSEGATAYTVERMIEIADSLGMDQATFEACLGSPTTTSLLSDINTVARARDVEGTPTIFINGERVPSTDRSFETLSEWIESLR